MPSIKTIGLSNVILGFALIILVGCASQPYVPPAPSYMTINTIPQGADLSINGSYVGVSPLQILAPELSREDPNDSPKHRTYLYNGTQPLMIEASLTGYETKAVSIGVYQPPHDIVLTRMVETWSMIYRAPVGTKTLPAYYEYPAKVDIKLNVQQ